MFCSRCGKEVKGMYFCAACGHPVHEFSKEQENPSEVQGIAQEIREDWQFSTPPINNEYVLEEKRLSLFVASFSFLCWILFSVLPTPIAATIRAVFRMDSDTLWIISSGLFLLFFIFSLFIYFIFREDIKLYAHHETENFQYLKALCIRACDRFFGIFLAFLAITSSLHKILDRYPLLRLMIYLPFILCIFIYWIPAIRRMRRENRHLILLASMITLKEIWLHILLITLAYFSLLFLYILSKKDKYSYSPAVFFTLALLTLLFLVFLILRNRRAARTIRLYT